MLGMILLEKTVGQMVVLAISSSGKKESGEGRDSMGSFRAGEFSQ